MAKPKLTLIIPTDNSLKTITPQGKRISKDLVKDNTPWPSKDDFSTTTSQDADSTTDCSYESAQEHQHHSKLSNSQNTTKNSPESIHKQGSSGTIRATKAVLKATKRATLEDEERHQQALRPQKLAKSTKKGQKWLSSTESQSDLLDANASATPPSSYLSEPSVPKKAHLAPDRVGGARGETPTGAPVRRRAELPGANVASCKGDGWQHADDEYRLEASREERERVARGAVSQAKRARKRR